MTHSDPKSTPARSHGGFRWRKPDELKQVRISITLSPEAIELLKPYTRNGQRSQIIEMAIREFLEKKGKYS